VEDLCRCAQTGDLQGASTLINAKGVSLHITDQSGYLPLHYAISNGHLEIVRLFLENGVDASCYLSGYSSMEIAARYGQIDCIYELLRYNISIEEAGASGITDHIQLKGPQQATGALEMTMSSSPAGNSNSSNTPLMSAIRCSQVECVAELINLGANIYV
jgi:ankyrin repeat protein